MPLNPKTTLVRLKKQDFDNLFVDELGWDRVGKSEELNISFSGYEYALKAIAHKQGFVAYHCPTPNGLALPDHATRLMIDRKVTQHKREHIIIFTSSDKKDQIWQWVRRKPGQPIAARTCQYTSGQSGDAILQKLEGLFFHIDDEDHLNLTEATQRVERALNVDKVTKKFFDKFQKEHSDFLKFIDGIHASDDRTWYASVMLNRLMFIYFVQKKGFLDNNTNYLADKLAQMQKNHGHDKFYSFYRYFLLKLFHEGLGKKEHQPELRQLIGKIPYLNGGLFDIHELEKEDRYGAAIQIPDEAFQKIFAFFDQYQWHLDDRKAIRDNEINPDVLGYIFEKYINNKQMGAYYTKEDITEYISKNTIIPHLFDSAEKLCKAPFQAGSPGSVWSLLAETPDRYIYDAVKKGHDYTLPPEIAQGLNPPTLSQAVGDGLVATLELRKHWNKPADEAAALPTETWREFIARQKRYHEIHQKLAAGEIHEINDLITLNLDIRQFAHDVIESAQSPALVRAFWESIEKITVLDPTCGSGAFLFAALNILEPLYDVCLKRMEQLVTENSPEHQLQNNRFKTILDDVNQHPNRSYYILKSIILRNLFGVDIMEEATEICKLRLFLKLAAQVSPDESKPNMGIEPLPDIDFNIRAGNTLVGYATQAEVENVFRQAKGGQNLIQFGEDKDAIEEFRLHMSNLSRTMNNFRNNQQTYHFNPAQNRLDKLKLEKDLNTLRQKLDEHLAGFYGIDVTNKPAFTKWKKSHEPFHWFVEFYGILGKEGGAGGFDVVIGNPPYVEAKSLIYKLIGFHTEACQDLYAFTIERSLNIISKSGRNGMIVPISISGTGGFSSLRDLLMSKTGVIWLSNYAERPSKLFEGVEKRLAIFLLDMKNGGSCNLLHTSSYRRWLVDERANLFYVLTYINLDREAMVVQDSIPKFSNIVAPRILKKMTGNTAISLQTIKSSDNIVYYTRKLRYFIQFFLDIPKIFDEQNNRLEPSELKTLCFDSELRKCEIAAALNSSLFFWFFCVFSDVRNVNKREIDAFPLSLSKINSRLSTYLKSICIKLDNDFDRNSEYIVNNYKKYGKLKIQSFNPRLSKPIIDQIDTVLAQHYGFTEEELDFIINYDIKYRMGRDGDESDSDE